MCGVRASQELIEMRTSEACAVDESTLWSRAYKSDEKKAVREELGGESDHAKEGGWDIPRVQRGAGDE